jgi:hypothetical protein
MSRPEPSIDPDLLGFLPSKTGLGDFGGGDHRLVCGLLAPRSGSPGGTIL